MTAKTEMRREPDSPRFYELIRMGEEACAAGAPKNPPDELNWQDRHTWMAGWHDQDVAMGNREVLYRPASAGADPEQYTDRRTE